MNDMSPQVRTGFNVNCYSNNNSPHLRSLLGSDDRSKNVAKLKLDIGQPTFEPFIRSLRRRGEQRSHVRH